MAADSVAYRLKSAGAEDIINEFRKIEQAGEQSGQVTTRAWDKTTRQMEGQIKSLEANLMKLGNLSQSDAQNAIARSAGSNVNYRGAGDSTVSIDREMKNAAQSASIFTAEMDRQAQVGQRLLAAIDPLVAAQQRYDHVIEQATASLKAGGLTQQQYTRIQAEAKGALDAMSGAHITGAKSAGQQRAAYQQLGYQVQDITQGFALGVNPLVILAQQGGQTASALEMGLGSGGKAGAVARFIAGPWGSLIIAGTAILGMMVVKSREAEKASDDLKGALDFQKMSHQEIAKAIKEQVEASEAAIRVSAAAEIQARNEAAANVEKAVTAREATKALLETMKVELARAENPVFGTSATSADAASRIGSAYSSVASLEAEIRLNNDEIKGLQDTLQNKQFTVGKGEAAAATDPRARVNRRFELREAELQEQARKERWSQQQTTRALTDLAKARKAELDVVEEAAKAAREGSKDKNRLSAVTGASLNAQARKFIGLNENQPRDNAVLRGLFKEANINIDPKITAWCAAFVNAVLATEGLPSNGKLNARSFLDYGKSTDAPRKGDIAVLRRGQNSSQGHVGFFDGFDKNGNPILLSGNAGGGKAVTRQAFNKKDVLGYRRVGSPGEMIAKAEEEALKRQRELDQMLGNVQGKYDASAVAAANYAIEIKRINELLAEGKINPDQAVLYKDMALEEKMQARAGLLGDAIGIAGIQNQAKPEIESGEERERQRKFVKEALADQKQLAQSIELERSLIGASNSERDRALAQFDAMNILRREGVNLESDQAKLFIAGNIALAERSALLDQQQEQWERFVDVGEYAVDQLLNPRNWDDWGDAAMSVLDAIMQEMITLAAINPIKNALFGSGLSTLGGIFGGGGGFDLGFLGGNSASAMGAQSLSFLGNAVGTEHFRGGMTMVGENGAELVSLPRGSKVSPAAETRRLLSGAGGAPKLYMPITIDAQGADAAGLARVENELRQLRRDLPATIVSTVGDAQGRFVLSGAG